jgi:hypothetical protein
MPHQTAILFFAHFLHQVAICTQGGNKIPTKARGGGQAGLGLAAACTGGLVPVAAADRAGAACHARGGTVGGCGGGGQLGGGTGTVGGPMQGRGCKIEHLVSSFGYAAGCICSWRN